MNMEFSKSSSHNLIHPKKKCKKEGRRITGFTNTEEAAVQLTDLVPFLLEDELKKKGGLYSKKEDWTSYVVTDGLLITGQNPASSKGAAEKLLELLKEEKELIVT